MRLGYILVSGNGLAVHAWASDQGVCALRVGEVPPAGTREGAHPVEGVEIVAPGAALRELADALERYLAGARLDWEGTMDQRGVTAFQRQVFDAVRTVVHGDRTTYGDVAARIGQPGAVRAVGNALRRNPFPIVVPCHRIVRVGGALGGYSGGVGAKARLLALEAGQGELPLEGGGS